jgi:hypothetical protein
MNRKPPARRGYALMLVIVFLVIFLAMLGTAWRQVASVLRVETVRAAQTQRDQGALLAALQTMHRLEADPTLTSPLEGVVVDGFTDYTFNVTFEHDSSTPPIWTIKAVRAPPL